MYRLCWTPHPTPATKKREKHSIETLVKGWLCCWYRNCSMLFDKKIHSQVGIPLPWFDITGTTRMLTFDGRQIQQDSSECLMMLIEIINKGSVPYCGSNDNNCTGVSLSEILFSCMLEKYIVCDACGVRSPSIESSIVLYITPTYTSDV